MGLNEAPCATSHIFEKQRTQSRGNRAKLETLRHQPRRDAMIPVIVLKRLAVTLACAGIFSAPLFLA